MADFGKAAAVPIAAKRGRKSTASLAVRLSPLDKVPRAEAPAELTKAERAVWVGVVNGKEADWFSPATAPLLEQYCRLTVQARHVGAELERMRANKATPAAEQDRFQRMLERATAMLVTLSTKMRITQQARRGTSGNPRASQVAKPWDTAA